MEPSGVSFSPSIPFSAVRHALAAATIAVVAACQSPATTSNPAGTTAASAGPASAAPTQAPSESPPGLFHIVGTAPVLARTMFPDRTAILPSGIVVDGDGLYHAWVVAFTDTPGTQDIHYLTSPDAVTWTEVQDASLTGLSDGFQDPGAFPTSIIETADGWVMYLTGWQVDAREAWEVWRATAPAPGGPWTRGDGPVLQPGDTNAWDGGGVDFPTVVATATGYTMFYSATDPNDNTRGAIGRATSTDGIEWTKDDGPVAEPSLCGGFDLDAIHQPRVIATAANLVMVYAGYVGGDRALPTVGYADSLDGGETWGCQWPGPALDTTGLPTGNVHTVNAFQHGDRVGILVEWLSGNGTDVWLADLGLSAP